MKAPLAKKIPHSIISHGTERIDDYFWMRERENPEVIDHLNKENEYTDFMLKDQQQFQKELFNEMKSRIKEDDSSVPYFKNGYWYYSRYEEGKEHPIYCRRKDSMDNEELILLDENELAKPYSYYEVVSFSVSVDNKLLAFCEDISGRRMYQLRVLNLENGKVTDILAENCGSDLAWHNNNKSLYFLKKDTETLRPHRVYKLELGSEENQLVYEEQDETYICGVSKSTDFSTIFIGSYSTLTTEHQYKSASNDDDFKALLERKEGHEYYPEILGNTLYIKSNFKAENFKLFRCNINNTAIEEWETVQEVNENVLIEDFELFRNHLVVQEREGVSRLRIYDLSTMESRIYPMKEDTYSLYIGTNPDFDTDKVRVGYSSLTTPHSVLQIDLNLFEEKCLKQTEVLGDFSPENYESKLLTTSTTDGARLNISLVYRKDLFSQNGENPLLLYGYGSYGSTVDAYFSSSRLSLLNRGFVFAIAHIRGSEFNGRSWYEDGKLLKKKNTFSDFIEAGEYLVENKYGHKDKIFAMGGSAGGLLMGVVANWRPELWRGIVSQVPFVDVINTMEDDSIPLTTGEYDEWGNPADKKYFDYMLSYSPYDQIEAKNYPPMLVTSGLHDSQVQYWEPTKYVAKLRELKTDNNRLLLHTNMDAGHGGASGRFEQLKEIALTYSFILSELEISRT
ncbi:MAG: S9 family peptidase [Flavobacteriales bacterium]|nr:S9 family peptidase [Flavobacteriales bacterium]